MSLVRAAPPGAGSAVSRGRGGDESHDDEFDEFFDEGRTSHFEGAKTVHSPTPLFGMAADQDLMYFLRKSGATVPTQRRSPRAATRSEVPFQQLVANLERQS